MDERRFDRMTKALASETIGCVDISGGLPPLECRTAQDTCAVDGCVPAP